jgi:HEAT repeat protein
MDAATLQKLLHAKRTEDRIRGVTLLAQSDLPEKPRLLFQLLNDSANYVASLAAEALGECADWSLALEMADKFLFLSEKGLTRDPGCHIRAHLAFAFGRLEYPGAVEALRIGIRTVQIEAVGGVPFDTGAHLRANCALALAQMHAPDALRDITLLLFNMSGHVPGDSNLHLAVEPRKAAAQAMVILGDRNALTPLAIRLTYTQGELAEVLQECMQAVVELEDERAVELLEPYLQHHDPHLSAYAALMIARTRDPAAPRLLTETLTRLSGDPLRGVVMAFNMLRSEEGRTALHALANEKREEVRLAVVDALADSTEDRDRKVLKRLAESDTSAIVRNAAKRAL